MLKFFIQFVKYVLKLSRDSENIVRMYLNIYKK